MRKLTASEKHVLSHLIHTESWDTLISETGLQYGELRDDLTNLLSSKLIQAYPDESSESNKPSVFYDLDNLQDFSFRITGRGLDMLKRN